METLKKLFKISDVRKKVLFTLLILAVYRLGCAIPVPFIQPAAASILFGGGSVLGYLNLISGGALAECTLFAIGVTPYINASIITQLLGVTFPRLGELAKDGEEGRRKLNKINKAVALAFSLVLSAGYWFILRRMGALSYTEGFAGVICAVIIVVSFVAGTQSLVWLGEKIESNGIGSGISLIIFTGIIANWRGIIIMYQEVAVKAQDNIFAWGLIPCVILLILASMVFVVFYSGAEQRIPIIYAKRVVGRKMYGGNSNFIPLKLNLSGVMPVIFSSAILSIPSTLSLFFPLDESENAVLFALYSAFSYRSLVYAVFYAALIFAFNYFYVAIQYDPMEMANNLRTSGATIPGIRPGKATMEYINKALWYLCPLGALFLMVIAITPILVGAITGINIALSGTSLLIVTGVAVEVTRNLESQLEVRNHKGFLS